MLIYINIMLLPVVKIIISRLARNAAVARAGLHALNLLKVLVLGMPWRSALTLAWGARSYIPSVTDVTMDGDLNRLITRTWGHVIRNSDLPLVNFVVRLGVILGLVYKIIWGLGICLVLWPFRLYAITFITEFFGYGKQLYSIAGPLVKGIKLYLFTIGSHLESLLTSCLSHIQPVVEQPATWGVLIVGFLTYLWSATSSVERVTFLNWAFQLVPDTWFIPLNNSIAWFISTSIGTYLQVGWQSLFHYFNYGIAFLPIDFYWLGRKCLSVIRWICGI